MKATELRLCSKVETFKGKIESVTAIYTMEGYVEIHTDTCVGIDKDYKPIPLTEEWLLKFGFIRQGSRNMWVKDKLCIDLKELPNIRGEFIEGWYIGLKDLGNVLFHSFMKIEHVHQLQNLYFALTGEELTVKELA